MAEKKSIFRRGGATKYVFNNTFRTVETLTEMLGV